MWDNFWFQGFSFFSGLFNAYLNIKDRMNKYRVTHILDSCCSVPQSCPTLCNPMDYSTPGFPVHHQCPKLAQIHVHRISDAIHPSHPLSSPSPPAFNLSQHQGLFQGVSSSHQVAKVLEFHFSISSSNQYSGLIFYRIN